MHNTWFHKTLLIARREYLERVRTKAFIVSTILIPLLMCGFVLGGNYMDTKQKPTISHVTLVTSDTQLGLNLQKQLESLKNPRFVADLISPPDSSTRDILNQELDDKSLDGYLSITPNTSSGAAPSAVYTTRSTRTANNPATHAIERILLAAHIQPLRIEHKPNAAQSSSVVAYVLFFLMYAVVMLYGMNVARSIIEEKTSRVFEVLLSTIRPEEMMAGKIIGVGGVGLTQIAIWMLAAGLLSATPIGASLAGGDLAIAITTAQILFFLLYFVFGFLLYSSMAAALGAMTNSEQELQQLNMFLVMPLAFCMLMLPVVTSDPNSFWSKIVSLIPFCSPLLMNFRISLHMPAVWEIGLSFVLMSITICAIIWIASRIYRIGVLMYGKRPDLSEIIRWLKYS
jgi:ABC-2 type transport system permease protein